MNLRIVLILLSFLFVIFSFSPSLYELASRNQLPTNRTFVLEHNYMFDYNFYLSRIRQGMEGRWLVVEKYYSEPHGGSLFQIVYLYLGKLGGVFSLSPTAVYHVSRLIFGFVLLFLISRYCQYFFKGWWVVVCFLFVVTMGSFPVLVFVNGIPRFATHMGWWSAIDSLQRITFIPHILIGQIGLLLFLRWFSEGRSLEVFKLLMMGVLGFLIGIIFPPTLIVMYVFFVVLTVLEFVLEKKGIVKKIIPRIIFFIFSFPSLIYLKLMFQIQPWKALAIFDIEHRILLPYGEYFLALGPLLPLGILGGILVLIKKKINFYPLISWVVSVFVLFMIFENVPEQSPSRFTEAALNIPLGILATYFFVWVLGYIGHLRYVRIGVGIIISLIILMGLGVMVSMVGWLTDQIFAKRVATFNVPIGAQLAYPLTDFMEGVYYLADSTDKNSVVLTYVTAGNFIPAYAGNFVYIGHANTPDENWKEIVVARFFKGEMSSDEARKLLKDNRIRYIFFGPQEKELGGVEELLEVYPFMRKIYQKGSVTLYHFIENDNPIIENGS